LSSKTVSISSSPLLAAPDYPSLLSDEFSDVNLIPFPCRKLPSPDLIFPSLPSFPYLSPSLAPLGIYLFGLPIYLVNIAIKNKKTILKLNGNRLSYRLTSSS
jgi:hypothetical protein